MLKSRQGQNGYVAIKLDLEKAYDRLEWSFIKESLEFFQMPPNLITLIRQGDPLSPYLFILCLEMLSIMLEEAIRDRLIHPINFRGQVRLSHLFFTDDIFLLTTTKASDSKNLFKILQNLYASLGHLMSVTKSQLWFSPSKTRCIKK